MSEKKRKSRRAYLDSYKKKEDGRYVYEGEIYLYVGNGFVGNDSKDNRLKGPGSKAGNPDGNGLKKELARLCFLCGALLCVLLAAGCSTAPGPDSSAYVLLPYAANLVACVSVCWGMGRLVKGGNPLKGHVYEASVAQIPGRALVCAICSGAVVTGEGIYLFQNGADGRILAVFGFLVLETAALILALWTRKLVVGMKWEKS